MKGIEIYNYSKLPASIINSVAKRYNILDYYTNLLSLLQQLYPTDDLSALTKYQIHEKLNEVLIGNYRGECVIKYNLFERNSINTDIVGAFEMNVNESRLDFITIGQQSTAYEIKSGLDSLSKLQKQCLDYTKVFEYNYLVVDACHLQKAIPMLPECYGIWCINGTDWQKTREATLSPHIDPTRQLKLLTKKELLRYFPFGIGNQDQAGKQYDADETNQRFKMALKQRYSKRWNFIVCNKDAILPLDIQFFFNHNISPSCIYQ